MALFIILSLGLVAGAAAQSCPDGLSSSEVNSILDAHNNLRKTSSPFMPKILAKTWDCGLEQIAQKFANQCEPVQDDSDNLSVDWYSQKFSIDCAGSEDCEKSLEADSQKTKLIMAVFNSSIGRATKMATGRSTKFGCGVAVCSQQVLVACNYEGTNGIDSSIFSVRTSTSCEVGKDEMQCKSETFGGEGPAE